MLNLSISSLTHAAGERLYFPLEITTEEIAILETRVGLGWNSANKLTFERHAYLVPKEYL